MKNFHESMLSLGGIMNLSTLPEGWYKDELVGLTELCSLTTGLTNNIYNSNTEKVLYGVNYDTIINRLKELEGSLNNRPSMVSNVFIINNFSLNGFATLNNGQPIVGLFAGLIFILRGFYLSLLSDELLLQNIDDLYYLNPKKFEVDLPIDEYSNNTKNNRDLVSKNWNFYRKYLTYFDPKKFMFWGDNLLKINKHRADLAIMLSLQASVYFTFHEVGHVALGHTSYNEFANRVVATG